MGTPQLVLHRVLSLSLITYVYTYIGIPLQDAVSCSSQGPFIFSMPSVKKESESREMSYLESEQVVRERIFVPVVTRRPGNDWPGAMTIGKCWEGEGALSPLTMTPPCRLAPISLSGDGMRSGHHSSKDSGQKRKPWGERGERNRRESEEQFMWIWNPQPWCIGKTLLTN